MRTTFDTLKDLALHTINHLGQSEIIEFGVDHRAEITEKLATELNVSFATDEDIKEQAIEEVQEKFGEDNSLDDITETEMFNHARKEIIKSYNGENIAGLYMVESLRDVAIRIKNFLLSCDLIDEVYADDTELIAFLVEKIRDFSSRRN
jgi:cell division ATPase FtsA